MAKRVPPPATPEAREVVAPLFAQIDPLPPSAPRDEILHALSELGYQRDETKHGARWPGDHWAAPDRNETMYSPSESGPISELTWTKRYISPLSGIVIELAAEPPPEDKKMFELWAAGCDELKARYGKPTKKLVTRQLWHLPHRERECWWWRASAGRAGVHEYNVSLKWSFKTSART